MADPLFEINHLGVRYHGGPKPLVALQEVGLSLAPGKTLGLVGESGCGKSTLSHTLMGLLPPEAEVGSGELIFRGETLPPQGSKDWKKWRGRSIAMIFQDPIASLNPSMSIESQLMEALKVDGRHNAETSKSMALQWIKKVRIPQPETVLKKYPHQLSGGMCQRVCIAMALCAEPDLLIADEATTALDVTTQKAVLDLVDELQAESGSAVLMVSHDLGVVADHCDDVAVIRSGIVVEQGPCTEVLAHPQNSYTKALLQAIPRLEGGPPGAMKNDPSLSSSCAPSSPTTPRLTVEDLVVAYGETPVVRGVSFQLHQGECLGLIGESGCGKTTLARALCGLVPHTSGHWKVEGGHDGKSTFQMIFQNPMVSLNPRMRCRENVAESLRYLNPTMARSQQLEIATAGLAQVGLPSDAGERYPHQLSGGQLQRVCIARALAPNPKVLLCDEPVSALDVSIQAQILELLQDLQKKKKLSMIFVSHDLAVVRHLCPRTLVMAGGQIVENRPTPDLIVSPTHPTTQALMQAVPGRSLPSL